MLIKNSSSFVANDTKRAVNLQNKMNTHPKTSLRAKAFIALLLTFGLTGMVAAADTDPLAGDAWHAVKGSWPGTIKFDGKSKKVLLEPYGSEAINASYSYTLAPADSFAAKSGNKAGTLVMTNTLGQVSKAEFRIEGKELTLSFPSGFQAEHYKRMTKAEEDAEIHRIEKLMAEGKLKLPR
ncbi:uncharacterized protein NMK_2103 [Novimethylophilus kurashikiensis]|uniref:Uncharacterized protein n=1 Tax=Novimethylophilus kurashikiensis TaxID=1825523 RepID=A0A2R5FCY7_9PROT|nr:hypothetical protein [Novimethylophilus kurashikiensis]GBG14504.1 uncharacterized protein NMK_2103 [Novimethylophilus kurashikiensis]